MRPDDPDFLDAMAAEFALGALEGEERQEFERRLAADPGIADLVAEWEGRLASLGGTLAPVVPPPRLKQAVLQQLNGEAVQGGFTLRRDDGIWEDLAPGLSRRRLQAGSGEGAGSVLFRLAPGCVCEPHDHALDEECYILEGEIDIDGVGLRAGDYFYVRAGGRHGPIHSATGALLFIRGEAA